MSIPKKIVNLLNSALSRTINAEILRGPFTYNEDGLVTRHNADFMREPGFVAAYDRAVKTQSWGTAHVHWRAHVVGWAARNGLTIEGDFVECGVNKGAMAAFIQSYADLETSTRRFWLLDTYSGLVERYLTEAEKQRGSKHWQYEECFEAVKSTFKDEANVILVKGEIPGTLTQVSSPVIAYLGIDLNCMQPEIAAAEFFWNRLSKGAMIVLDDYGWAGHLEQKLAFDAFARQRGVDILSLPTGQAILIKP